GRWLGQYLRDLRRGDANSSGCCPRPDRGSGSCRIYTGTVRRLVDFGAFVEILPGKEGLVRTSQLADYQVSRPEDVVSVADEITVMVVEVDPQGRINMSRRAGLLGGGPPSGGPEGHRPPAPWP